MFLVGLTGGIGTGKSTASKFMIRKGLHVIDGDEIAREVVKPGSRGLKKIVSVFGPSVLDSSGELDRQALGEIVFKDALARQKLNAITHPEIYKSIFKKCLKYFITGNHYVVLDLPLLFESGKMIPYLKHVIVIKCSEEQQLTRLMSRNNFSQKEAEDRISSQWPLSKKCALADSVIDNSGTIEETTAQLELVVEKLNQSKAYWKLRLTVAGVLLLTFFLGKGIVTVLR